MIISDQIKQIRSLANGKPLLTMSLLITLTSVSVDANEAPLEENVAIPDVVSQFKELRTDGEWIGAYRSASVPTTGGTSKNHYQGIVRGPYVEGKDNNILYVTKSGDRTKNYLGTVEIGTSVKNAASSAKHGERLGGNLFVKDKKPGQSAPNFGDWVVNAQKTSYWKHPGGQQIVGSVMAVPYEQPLITQYYTNPRTGVLTPSQSKIHFYDTRNPTAPKGMQYSLDMIEAEAALSGSELARVQDKTGRNRIEAGVVALTKLPNGKFMLLVTYALDAVVIAFVSNDDSFFEQKNNGTWVENRNFEFEFYDIWFAEEQYQKATNILDKVTFYGWPWADSTSDNNSFISSIQQLSLINQVNGRLFLIGSFNTSKAAPVINGKDLVRLYEVRGYQDDPLDNSGQLKINYQSEKHLHMSSGDGEKFGNGNAGLGAYTSPTRELILYGVAHYEDGDVLRISEYRHRDMAFAGDKIGVKFRPNHLGEPVTIEPGQSITLNASSRYIYSWADYYEDANYNSGNGSKRILIHEATSQHLDDYDNFGTLDSYHDKMSSFRMGLEPNIVLSLYKDDSFERRFFNYFSTLSNGSWNTLITSSNVGNSDNDELSSATMFDIAQQYSVFRSSGLSHQKAISLVSIFLQARGVVLSDADINLRRQLRQWEWDLDGNGSYETKTSAPRVTFSSQNPGVYHVRVKHGSVSRDVDGNLVQKIITVGAPPLPDSHVPNLIGMSYLSAITALQEAVLQEGDLTYDYDDNLPIDFVTGHSPSAGLDVPANTEVDMTLSLGLRGDIDIDDDVDRDDIKLIMAARNTPANESFDRRDVDENGIINVLDMRKVALLCTRPRCATE